MELCIGAIGIMTNGALLACSLKKIAYTTVSLKINKNKEKELKNTRIKMEQYPYIWASL